MSDQRQTKNERREAAREAARQAREKAQKRQKLVKWLVPTSVSAAILAIAVIVVLVIVTAPPPPEQSQAGPRNMISGGIAFVGDEAGGVEPVLTAGIPEDGEPVPTVWDEADGRAHVEAYVDFSCPACRSFEENYGDALLSLVASGQTTMEIHPIAILDTRYAGSRYSTRATNVGMCVAEHAPESFLDVQTALFAEQPSEGTRGHDNGRLVSLVHSAGLENATVDQCIRDEYFSPFIQAQTERTTSDEKLRGPQGFSTPTYVVNGQVWDRSIDLLEYIQGFISAGTDTDAETPTE